MMVMRRERAQVKKGPLSCRAANGYADARNSVYTPPNSFRAVLAVFVTVAVFHVQVREAHATGSEKTLRADDLVVTIDSIWAGGTWGGYYPVRMQVTNRGRARTLTFHISAYEIHGTLPDVRRTIRIDQNATARFEIPVPMVGTASYAALTVSEGGRPLSGLTAELDFQPPEADGAARPALLVISPQQVDCSAFENAIDTMTMDEDPRSYYAVLMSTDSQFVDPSLLPDQWISYSGLDVVAVSMETFANLPAEKRSAIIKWVESGGSLIVFAVGERASDSQQLSSLLGVHRYSMTDPQWQQSDPAEWIDIEVNRPQHDGSSFDCYMSYSMVCDCTFSDTEESCGETDQEQAELQRQKEIFTANRWRLARDVFESRPMMLGQVYAFKEDPFPGTSSDWRWFLKSVGSARLNWPQRNGISSRTGNFGFYEFLIPGISTLPKQAFLILITLFAIVIGPINYIWLLRRGQLYLLVLTIPTIALLTSLSLFGYSIVAHGFGVKSRMRSITVLDQSRRAAISTTRMALYAGLAPTNGLSFSQDSAVFPIWPLNYEFNSGSVDWTESQALESGWLRSRTRTQFVVQSHRDERGRLEISPSADDRLEVANGLAWDLDSLIIVDDNGTIYAGHRINANATAQLGRADKTTLRSIFNEFSQYPLEVPEGINRSTIGVRFDQYANNDSYLSINFDHSLLELTLKSFLASLQAGTPVRPRSYIAILNEPPGIDVGLDSVTERASRHFLLGYY